MKSFIPLALLFIGLLTGCASTESNTSSLAAEEVTLTDKVRQYPNDSLALRDLVQYQLELFDTAPDYALLNRLEANLRKGLDIAPSERYFAYHYYRINLQRGLVEERYDNAKWQAFYVDHPFLARLDLAPPSYVNYLLNDLQGAEKVAVLQQSLQDNSFFMNAYLELARHYSEQDKLQLAIYLMRAARKHNDESADVLSDLIYYRGRQLSEQACHTDISGAAPQLLALARTLTQMVPNNPFFQSQLADAFRLNGKYPLATFAAAKAVELDHTYQDFLLELYLWDTRLDKIANFVVDEAQQSNELILLTKIYASISAGDWAQAAGLANIYSGLEGASSYGVIYGAYSYSINGNAEGRERLLRRVEANFELDNWQHSMLEFARGEISEEQLMDNADNRCKRSEALFVAALQHIENKQSKQADSYWQRILDLGVSNYFEYGAARNRVKALKTH